jgi:hypothetical protein
MIIKLRYKHQNTTSIFNILRQKIKGRVIISNENITCLFIITKQINIGYRNSKEFLYPI